ncbi:MAG: hypothetical protein COW85_00965 [Ignavibacteria bacterium CG22_combo_CG10-13_8_21_14_all_37_15]|nr:hypothetical protein [Ignavibacteria bacterium]OIO14872.1 MAG: hypothetical protein AUJ54_13670 [Ignavibacteria bacterium CG1_02_37_35]PIP79497.1 MAG: hypothetical protein COW85_00965 [Ignavibacteria bacterium CG22_combo_CG10-13_8_21_14_all_37_15]PIX95513.1 MAG: hypothetical protein COZ25_00080 [Ignavibacteria bacterium CG_4_10_14_3_um_filter_37_18]PJC57937.1 MAG: hypothetical protein CO025_10850 [Ignavibacteria bacterium CG_4_9_14_0_2_um_filter_37_13]
MKKHILAVVLVTIVLFNPGCKKSPTEAIDNTQPGRRDYVWTVDTLKIPYTVLTRMWGSSPTDLWAIGPGGDLNKTIFHFDGTSWKNDGKSRPISPTSIWGSSANNIWIGGREGKIWNYTNGSWGEAFTYSISGFPSLGLECIWGDSPDNVYAVGYADSLGIRYKGVILHFNGSSWRVMETEEIKNGFISITRAPATSSNYFIKGIRMDPATADTVMIYEFDGTNLKRIQTKSISEDRYPKIVNAGGKLLFVIDRTIYSYTNQQFKSVYNIGYWNFVDILAGRSEKDLFLSMNDGIAHYNGTDVEYIYRFTSNISITCWYIFEKDIVFIAYDFVKDVHLIYRGKLKN